MSIIASAILAVTVGFTGTTCDYSMKFENGVLVSIDEKAYSNYVTRVERQQVEMNEMKKLVDMLWLERINRLARVMAHKEHQAKQAAIQKVRENVKKHKSAMGKSSGGVKK